MILPRSDRGLRCQCGSLKSRVLWMRRCEGGIKRSRECMKCRQRTRTIEVAILDPAKKI